MGERDVLRMDPNRYLPFALILVVGSNAKGGLVIEATRSMRHERGLEA